MKLGINVDLFQFQQDLIELKKEYDATLKLKKVYDNLPIKRNITDEEEQLKAVRENPYNIMYCINPSYKVQMESVRQSGLSIQFIPTPTKELELEAVKQSWEAIQFLRNPSEEVQLLAIRQTGKALRWIQNPSKLVQLEALDKYMYNPQNKTFCLETIGKECYMREFLLPYCTPDLFD